jgi:outer membrane immunogenic protein
MLAENGKRDTWTATSLADPPFGTPRTPIDLTSPRTYDTSGVRGGVYGGYNWQVSQFVFGIEANAGFADAKNTVAGFPGCTLAGCTIGFTYPPNGLIAGGDLTTVNMRWDASVRGRLGFLATPDLLLYGTGGVAFQNIKVTGACGPAANSFQCNVPQPIPSIVTIDKTLVGWTVGAGAEWHAWGNWLLRGEYRFADFGTNSYVFPFGTSSTNNTYRFNLRTETHIATFGIAYKF